MPDAVEPLLYRVAVDIRAPRTDEAGHVVGSPHDIDRDLETPNCQFELTTKGSGSMTAPQDQFVDIANHNQDPITTAIRTWSDAVQSFASSTTAGQSQLPKLSSVVDQYFDFAAKLLANQRQVARQWTSTTATASGAVTEQAQPVTQHASTDTTNVTETAVDNPAAAAPVAADTAADITRPADTDTGS